MNILIEKYKDCCKFCFGPSEDKSSQVLGTKELEDLQTIREIMGAEITDENADYAKVLKNIVCFKCASTLIVFRNYRIECNEKFKIFKKEFDQVQKGTMKKDISRQKYVCNLCFEVYQSEEMLDSHKRHKHKDQLPGCLDQYNRILSPTLNPTLKDQISVFDDDEDDDDRMEIDTTCQGGEVMVIDDKTDENDVEDDEIRKFYQCNDCHRQFPAEEEHIYLAHCRTVHPKKIPCPFGCLVIPMDTENPNRGKRKIFKNLYYLANHIQKQHLEVVKPKITT